MSNQPHAATPAPPKRSWTQTLRGLFAGKGVAAGGAAQAMSWRELQRMVSENYRRRGYEVRELSVGKDVGADLLLTKAAQRVVVLCQQWQARKLREQPVRELFGAMAAHNATAGILFNCGTISAEAYRFAGLGKIELIDAAGLNAFLQREDTRHMPGLTQRAAPTPESPAEPVKQIA